MVNIIKVPGSGVTKKRPDENGKIEIIWSRLKGFVQDPDDCWTTGCPMGMDPLARRNSLDPETGTPLHWAVGKIVLVAAEGDLLVTSHPTTERLPQTA